MLRGSKEQVFRFNLGFYERAVAWAVEAGGLEKLHLTPHKARHGGPSDDAAAQCRPLKAIQERGRWDSDRSVARYKRSGTLRRQESMLTPAQLATAAQLSQTFLARLCKLLCEGPSPPGP